MKKNVIKHWKSTVVGLVGAAAVAAYGVIQANGGVPNWELAGTAAAVAVIGAISRDFGVRG